MATVVSLPANPDLDHLRQQARALQQAVRAGEPIAVERVTRQHAGGMPEDPGEFTLSAAQLVVAREYGFASWPRLKHYVELVAHHGWDTSGPTVPVTGGDPADEFCRLACLTYSADDPARRTKARQLLADHPDLVRTHIWAAAAATDHDTIARLLAEDPGRATQRGGPYRWRPLYYLVYSRLDPDVSRDAVLATARALLDAGADPNEGYLWNALPTAFTLLTGAFGEGEQGPEAQPRHPHSLALARMLLDAGADANDGQALYNRMFQPDNDHLELLFGYGLGTGDGGVWKARLGEHLQTPAEMLRFQLRWAVDHDFLDRVRLLVAHGVDIDTAFDDGRTPVELAQLDGNTAVVEFLVEHGAPTPELVPADALVAALFRTDREEVERLRAEHPQLTAEVRESRPGLMVWAAANRRAGTVSLLAELGWDVDALSRGDSPVEQPWQAPLHEAASQGNLDLARLLLSLGADPNVRDARFDATPLGWAEHGHQEAMIELLEPLTDTASQPPAQQDAAETDD